MLGMAENPKLDSASSGQKISVSDHINGLQYTTDESDSFIIDMESFSHGGSNKEINPTSKITKSLSRKGSQRGDRDSFVSISSSPRGSSTPEKPMAVIVGSLDQASNPQVHHQITITTSNIAAATENRFSLRRNSSRRLSPHGCLIPGGFSCSLPHCRAWERFC